MFADAGLGRRGPATRRRPPKGIFHRDQRHGGVLHEPGSSMPPGEIRLLDFRRRARDGGPAPWSPVRAQGCDNKARTAA